MSTKAIQTVVAINAPPALVWSVLTNFPSMSSWNPFITAMSGPLERGARLGITVAPPGKSPMSFKPRILALEPEKELRWLGSVLVPGLFDGEHGFKLTAQADGTTFLTHGEVFRGLLVGLIMSRDMLDATQAGFEAMNQALKARAEALCQETG